MWISKRELSLFEEWKGTAAEASHDRRIVQQIVSELRVENERLKLENAHHLTTIDWFKLRLNAVERERSAWFAYVTGGGPTNRESIHVPPPQFAEGEPLSDRMNEQFNPYGEVGEDSLDPTDKIPTHVEDVSTMPRSRG